MSTDTTHEFVGYDRRGYCTYGNDATNLCHQPADAAVHQLGHHAFRLRKLPGSTPICGVNITGSRICRKPESDPIHSVSTPAEPVDWYCLRCKKTFHALFHVCPDCGGSDTRLASATPPAEAADAPPERIWLQRGQAIEPTDCTLSHVSTDGTGVEYISAAAHAAELGRLRDALQGAQETIESMRSENKLHGHITDASANYLHKVKPTVDELLNPEGSKS